EEGNEAAQGMVRIRVFHRLGKLMEAATGGEVVKDLLEQGASRAELLVHGKARHARLLGNRLQGEAASKLRGTQQRAGGSHDACACFASASGAHGTVIRARGHGP